MLRPKLYLLGPGQYSYRVDFRFVDADGNLLRSKTWELHHEQHEKPQALLLQIDARLVGGKPELQELGANYVGITTTIAAMRGDLSISTFAGFRPDAVSQQVAAFPLTLGVVLDHDGLSFSLFTAKPKNT
jgi:hypothetical protein